MGNTLRCDILNRIHGKVSPLRYAALALPPLSPGCHGPPWPAAALTPASSSRMPRRASGLLSQGAMASRAATTSISAQAKGALTRPSLTSSPGLRERAPL